MRVVVVGASSGLGRSLGVGFAKNGASVALLARRKDRIVEAAKDAGPGTLAITCDVTDKASCERAIDEAVKGLGGIDAVVYSAGIGALSRIEELDAETWHAAFGTNVVGASFITAAALPHLKESSGSVLYLSSLSASLTAPWPGLAAYTVTKAALDKLVEAWRAEHPEVGLTRVIVGECSGGEGDNGSQLTAGWNPELAMEMFPVWGARGLLNLDNLMDIDHFVSAVEAVLQTGKTVGVPTVAITPRRSL